LPEALLHAVVAAESPHDPNATLRSGVVGLMQLIPETAKQYAVRNRCNPSDNLSGDTLHLKHLLRKFNNNLTLVSAAYNVGENAVTQ